MSNSLWSYGLQTWSGLPCPSPGDLPNPGIESGSSALQADSLLSEPPEKPFYCYACCVLGRFSRVWLFATLWTVACQAPLSMGFFRQEYWSGLPFLPSRDLILHSGIEPASLVFPELAVRFFTTSSTWDAPSLSLTSPELCHYPQLVGMETSQFKH